MNKKTRYIIEGALLIVALVVLVKSGLIPGTKKNYVVAIMAPSYVFDVYSDWGIVGFGQNVFVGKVISQIGSKSDRPWRGAEGQFDVKVIYNIKGKVEGNIIVDQIGGLKDGIFHMVEGGSQNPEEYILQPGSTYLFAARKDDVEDWQVISVPGRSWQLVSNDPKLSDAELLAIAMKDPNVIKYKEAYITEQIPVGETFTAINTFKSLPVAEQEKIKADVAQMKAEASQPKAPEPVVTQEVAPEVPAVVKETTPDTGVPVAATE